MAPMSEADWRRKLDGSDQVRPKRRFWRSLPRAPRCKCAFAVRRAGGRGDANDPARAVGEEPPLLPRVLPGHRREPRRR